MKLQEKIPTVHSAINAKNIEGVKDTLNKDLAMAKDTGGRCALHLAIMSDQTDAVKYLVETFPESLKVQDNVSTLALHLHFMIYEFKNNVWFDIMVLQCRWEELLCIMLLQV